MPAVQLARARWLGWRGPRVPALWPLLALLCLDGPRQHGCRGVGAWNSFGTISDVYSFQEFYTDAQYGPDFGYYSTGAILHADGPADNGVGGAAQEWFNSYTTLPMSLSPDFADALCDRLVTMWQSMGRPEHFVVSEFGGGTGMLARDILRRARDHHREFYIALARYVIAERSAALRRAQQHTAAEFVAAGKLHVIAADAREASRVRPALLEAMGGAEQTVGFVISNELLDEFDPVRLRLMWGAGEPPSAERCASCDAYREAHVIHSVDAAALDALLRRPLSNVSGAETAHAFEEINWEGQSLHCGLLATPSLRQAALEVVDQLSPAERGHCAPLLVCCLPFLVAVNQALMFNVRALDTDQLKLRNQPSETAGQPPISELANLYRHHVQRLNGTVPLNKHRYRQLRRLARARGAEAEKDLLVGGDPAVVPGRIHTEEVFLALRPARCKELQGWMTRHAARLEVAARLRNGTAWIYDGDAGYGRTSMHLKLVVRPGEAAYVAQAANLLDEGFLVTLDYGADADALVWQALIRPNYEGILIMDARNEFAKECTHVSYLECPGLQDLTTSVDFTEVAEAGRHLGNWSVRAYGPIFLLELAFQGTALELGAPGDPGRLGHLVERAFGVRTAGLATWYQKPEQDPWASFKILVQHRGTRGGGWTLGALSNEWPLSSQPRLVASPSPCWRRDITKPPLASLIAAATHKTLEGQIQSDGAFLAAEGSAGLEAQDLVARVPEDPRALSVLLGHFQDVLMHSEPLVDVLDEQHTSQQQAYADLHLALLLVDYWHLVQEAEDGDVEGSLAEVTNIAESRRLPEIYGDLAFRRVLGDVGELIRNASSPGTPSRGPGDPDPPYACLAGRALGSRGRAAVI